MKNAILRVASAIVAVALAIAVLAAAWFAVWALAKDAIDRRTDINRRSNSAQTAYYDRVVAGIADIEALDAGEQTDQVQAQRRALVTETCRFAKRITVEIDPATDRWLAQNC